MATDPERTADTNTCIRASPPVPSADSSAAVDRNQGDSPDFTPNRRFATKYAGSQGEPKMDETLCGVPDLK